MYLCVDSRIRPFFLEQTRQHSLIYVCTPCLYNNNIDLINFFCCFQFFSTVGALAIVGLAGFSIYVYREMFQIIWQQLVIAAIYPLIGLMLGYGKKKYNFTCYIFNMYILTALLKKYLSSTLIRLH